MNTDQEILNLISDIRANVKDQEQLQNDISSYRGQLETAEDDLESVKAEIEKQREQLEQLIDEATGQSEGEPDDFTSLGASVFNYTF